MKNTTVRGIFSDIKKLNMKQQQEIKELKDEISFLNRKIYSLETALDFHYKESNKKQEIKKIRSVK